MQYNLQHARKSFGFCKEEMSQLMGITLPYYVKYEKTKEVPSKYIYKLWLSLEGFTIPEDFFDYTSFTLAVNMKYHKKTQTDIAKMFRINSQSAVSALLCENIPMYEMKEYFHMFSPLIVPQQAVGENKRIPLQQLIPRGSVNIQRLKEKEMR